MRSTGKGRLLVAWSSGKDSAWTLHVLKGSQAYELAGLLTTFNRSFDRVAMHAVRRVLVEAQARAVGLPLLAVDIPWPCSNAEYDRAMADALESAVRVHGITHVAFGDLFLEDIRAYRERMLQDTDITPVFPIWRQDTADLARRMVAAGLKARITCIDPKTLPESFAGRDFDRAFLDDLPAGVDPCGEYGEFHSFAYDGPMFAGRIAIEVGETVKRDGFVFTDVKPAEPFQSST